MKRHLLILLTVTLVVRGIMFVSFPLSGLDDNQAGQHYLIDRLVEGDLLIGNLRYNTGYPFLMAPVVALSQVTGPLSDRIVLAVQVALSAGIPFFIFDILRRTRSANEGLAVALLVAVDPYGLQWAHFYLPEWLIAFLLTVSFWLFVVARGNRRLSLALVAGALMGLAVLARVNALVVAVLLPAVVWWPGALTVRRRLAMSVVYLAVIGGLVAGYIVAIQRPSTGTASLSCVSGANFLEALESRGLRIQPENGPASRELRNLLARPALVRYGFLADTYPLWRTPGSWLTRSEQLEVYTRPPLFPYGNPAGLSPMDLIYVLGPCPADALFRSAFFESLAGHEAQYLIGTGHALLNVIVQRGSLFGERALPTVAELGAPGSSTAGFTRVSGGYYTGQVVWTPGVTLFNLWYTLNPWLKLLAIPAVLWALLSRKLAYAVAALLLLGAAFATVAVDVPEARIYSYVWMLWPMLIGGMIWAGYEFIRRRRRAA